MGPDPGYIFIIGIVKNAYIHPYIPFPSHHSFFNGEYCNILSHWKRKYFTSWHTISLCCYKSIILKFVNGYFSMEMCFFVEAVKKTETLQNKGKEKVKLSKGKQWKCLLCPPGSNIVNFSWISWNQKFFARW